MKNIRYILPLLVLVAGTGCKKFLNRDLEDQARGTAIDYTNINAMYSPVSGMYRAAGGENPGFTHWVDLGVRALRGDDIEKGSSPNDQGTLTDIKQFKNDNPGVITFWGNNNYWNDHYGLVLYCNEALTDLDRYAANIPAGDAANIALNNSYKGELRFIRAFSHLLISRVYGDVPIVVDNNTGSLVTVGKSSATDVRKWIIGQMDSSINFMEDARPNQASHVGAVTKYSALLLKAKAAADIAGNDNGSPYWDTVINATNTIINSGKFNLYADFYQLFKIPGKLSNEALYELQFTDFGTSTGTDVKPGAFFDFQGPNNNPQPISGWGFMSPTKATEDFLNGRQDSVRLKTTILYAGATPTTTATTPSGDAVFGNSNGQTRFMGKAYTPANQMTTGRLGYGSNNNVRVLRYADVLLLNAEAKVRKGQNGDVPFNLVRQRAKLNTMSGVTLQQVLDERRAEFACEWWGERYNDLLRTGQAATALASQGFAVGKEFVPVPQTQRDLNPNL